MLLLEWNLDEVFVELMSTKISLESLKLLRQIYCTARDQSILSVMDLMSGYPFLSLCRGTCSSVYFS